MKAFKVNYSGPGFSNSTTVLAEDKEHIRRAVADKDPHFDFEEGGWSKINNVREVPLSSVKVTDLTLVDLVTVLRSELNG